MTENEDTARTIAEEQSKPGTFSFLDRLNGRNYPTEDVEIYLDEAAGHRIQKLQLDRIACTDPEQALVIDEQIQHWREKARESRYVMHLEGISTEDYDATVDMAQAEYPIEWRESRNPLTMATERIPVENEDRDQLFRTHLWSKFIRSVEDSSGNVDANITPEFVAVVLGQAPLVAQGKIHEAIQELRMVTNWMDDIQGEDFLAKS